jgi:hypothetical protein
MKLYDHQFDAVRRIKNGCILCGGVGSGKSITAIAYYYVSHGGSYSYLRGDGNVYKKMTNPKDLYIITTAKKRDDLEWEGELGRFMMSTNPDFNIYKDQKVVVDSWNNIKKYSGIQGAFFIFDEQRVVGSGAWVTAFLNIAKNNEWILLSATPGDTWSDYIPVFIANGFFRNRTDFVRRHIIYNPFLPYRKVDRYIDTNRLVRLRDRILIKMDFSRSTVPHHEKIKVDYDVVKYRHISKERWNPFEDKPIETASEFCQVLRKLVNSDESRQVAVLEIMEKHPKSIIFYNYDYELDILKTIAYANAIEVAEWNGHKHQEVPDGEKWMYLVQYNAGAEGWNCIKTDTIIFYSQNYSYKIMTQASGRIDRMNTPYTDLYYYHLKSSSPIDRAISRALINKKKFNETKFYTDV